MKRQIFKKINHRQWLLFCPGPLNVASNVKEAVVGNEVGHREEEFSVLLAELNKKLLQVLQVKHRSKYHCVFLTGSGTAANEAILSSVAGNKKILVLANGEFGERLYHISKIHNPKTYLMQFNWGERIDLKKVETYLRKHPVDVLVMVHHETSTGMLNPVKEIGKLTKKYKLLFLLDCVSSVGAEDIGLEENNITFCSTSSSKALASLAGVSMVIGRKEEFEKLKDVKPHTAYLNLYKIYHFSTTFQQTPNTPAVQLFFALNTALSNILHRGVAKTRQNIRDLAYALRVRMKQLGLRFFLEEKDMSNVLTTVCIPDYVSVEVLQKELREKGIIVYPGKGPIRDKVFQVGNIGELNQDTKYFLRSLAEVLESRQETKFLRSKKERSFVPSLKISNSRLFPSGVLQS